MVPLDDRVTVAIAAYDPRADIVDRLPVERPAGKASVERLYLEEKTFRYLLNEDAMATDGSRDRLLHL